MREPDAAGPGPVRPRERVLAPDLARGLALLGIALANCVGYVYGRELGPLMRPVDGTPADRVVDALVGLLVDNRAFPMFTMLFAYGFVMILRRQAAAGLPWPQARAVLLRRSTWLAVVGAAHLLLLFVGDIVLTYGLLGLALVAAVRWGDRSLRLAGWCCLPVLAGFSALDGVPGELDGAGGVFDEGTALGALTLRAATLVGTVVGAPLYVAVLAPAAVVGILLARRGVLEQPGAHLPLLRRMSAGLVVSVAGAVPLVLMATQVLPSPPVAAAAAAALHGVTGLVGAVAFLGLVGWYVGSREVRERERERAAGPDGPLVPVPPPGGIGGALVAVGRRSLTCYLLQSVLFVPLLSPWALGVGTEAGTATLSAVAVGVYLTTVVVAVVLERTGRPGPAELLLRRLTYPQGRGAAAGTGAGRI